MARAHVLSKDQKWVGGHGVVRVGGNESNATGNPGGSESRSVPGIMVSREMGKLEGRKIFISHEKFLNQPGGEKQTQTRK